MMLIQALSIHWLIKTVFLMESRKMLSMPVKLLKMKSSRARSSYTRDWTIMAVGGGASSTT